MHSRTRIVVICTLFLVMTSFAVTPFAGSQPAQADQSQALPTSLLATGVQTPEQPDNSQDAVMAPDDSMQQTGATIASVTFLGSWGSQGSSDGQFKRPSGVAVGPDGTVYVADSGNSRIQRFSASGTFLGKWGSYGGSGDGRFIEPEGIAVAPDGTVYTSDLFDDRIQRFNATGAFLGEWQVNPPSNVGVAPDGTVYVTEAGWYRVRRFSATGAPLGGWGSPGYGDGQFNEPRGVAVAPDGTVYVVDSDLGHRIQRFRATGTFLGKWGSYGSGDGQFLLPYGVAVARDGTVYVADTDNHRIQIFSATGTFLGKWGSLGSGNGQFRRPKGVAVAPDGTIYVADTQNHRIQMFRVQSPGTPTPTPSSPTPTPSPSPTPTPSPSPTPTPSPSPTPTPSPITTPTPTQPPQPPITPPYRIFQFAIGAQAPVGQFNVPSGVAVAPDGTVYVADFWNHRIQRFSADGTFLGTWGSLGRGDGQFWYPYSVAVAPDGTVYVADYLNNRIQRFSADGTFLGTWGVSGSSNGEFSSPSGVAVASDGTVYVADTGNHRIQRFSADGTFLNAWGSEGSSNGQFSSPYGVAVAPDGTVYVADTGNHRIQRFSATGEFLGEWGSHGRGNGQFHHPSSVAVAPNGDVYVADYGNNRIQRFSADGSTFSWTSSSPRSIAVASDGTVYVASTEDFFGFIFHRIKHFRDDGTLIRQWGSKGSGNGQFKESISSVAVAPDGKVYAADPGNNRIQYFTANGRFLGKWGNEHQFNRPSGVAVSPDETVYVADTGNHRIQHFGKEGNFEGLWGQAGAGDGQFRYPEGVFVASKDTVYVADSGNNRIQVFGTDYPKDWRGEFFANDWLAGPVLHVENVPDLFLNRSWPGQPAATIPADHFTSRWMRYVNFPTGGRYRFTIRADDGVRFWVDDRLVVESWQPQSLTREVTVELSAGYHRLLLEHWDRDGGATLALEWASEDTAPQPPSGLGVTDYSAVSITLAWNDNSDNETGFYLYRWDGSGWRRIATLDANVTTYTDTGLNCGQNYRYQVSAYNAAGESTASEEVAASTAPCTNEPAIGVDLTISLYRKPNSQEERAIYEEIIRHLADALFEMSNGAHKLRTVRIYPNTISFGKDVLWVEKCRPNAHVSGYGNPQNGWRILMCDNFGEYTFLRNPIVAGYAIAHEMGHYFYSLYDEYQEDTSCDLERPSQPCEDDIPVSPSVMHTPIKPPDAEGNQYDWLNFSWAENYSEQTAQYRMYRASGWETLIRRPELDPRDGVLANYPIRLYHPELRNVAPASGQPPRIDLITGHQARSMLQIIWEQPAGASLASADITASLFALEGNNVTYPQPVRLIAMLQRTLPIAGATVQGEVVLPNGQTQTLTFRDDGVAPDALADDGQYSALFVPTQNGQHQYRVTFTNPTQAAVEVYNGLYLAPPPPGYQPDDSLLAPVPVVENFTVSAQATVVVSGVRSDDHGNDPGTASLLNTDNLDQWGHIERGGDRDLFRITVAQDMTIVVRVTDLAAGMQPRLRLLAGDGTTPISALSLAKNYPALVYTARAGSVIYAEVSHVDPAASGGVYRISAGSPIVSDGLNQVHIPIVIR